jgi:hypothetical protein
MVANCTTSAHKKTRPRAANSGPGFSISIRQLAHESIAQFASLTSFTITRTIPMFFNVVTNIEDFITACCSLAEASEFLTIKF